MQGESAISDVGLSIREQGKLNLVFTGANFFSVILWARDLFRASVRIYGTVLFRSLLH